MFCAPCPSRRSSASARSTISPIHTLAHLLKWDSVHGKFDGELGYDDENIHAREHRGAGPGTAERPDGDEHRPLEQQLGRGRHDAQVQPYARQVSTNDTSSAVESSKPVMTTSSGRCSATIFSRSVSAPELRRLALREVARVLADGADHVEMGPRPSRRRVRSSAESSPNGPTSTVRRRTPSRRMSSSVTLS